MSFINFYLNWKF